MQPQEVLPQEGARAEEPGQLPQSHGRRQQLQRGPGRLLGEHPVDQLAERAQRADRVGGHRQQVCELLDERHRHPKPYQLRRVLDLASLAARDQERVAGLGADARDLDLLDVEIAQGERRGERVQEARRVATTHLHARPVRVRRVVEVDAQRLQRAGGRLPAREALGQAPVQALAGLVGPTLGHEGQRSSTRSSSSCRAILAGSTLAESARGLTRNSSTIVRDECRAASERRGRRPRGRGRGAPEAALARCLRVGVAGLDVEAVAGQHAAEEGEGREEVEGDDGDVEPPARAPGSPPRARDARPRARPRGGRGARARPACGGRGRPLPFGPGGRGVRHPLASARTSVSYVSRLERPKAARHVVGQRRGVVERAGVEPHPLRPERPRRLGRLARAGTCRGPRPRNSGSRPK